MGRSAECRKELHNQVSGASIYRTLLCLGDCLGQHLPYAAVRSQGKHTGNASYGRIIKDHSNFWSLRLKSII